MLRPRIEPTRVGGAGGLPLLFDDVIVTGVCLVGGGGGFPFPLDVDKGVLRTGGGGGFPFGSDTVLGGGAGAFFADVPFASRLVPSEAWLSIELARF